VRAIQGVFIWYSAQAKGGGVALVWWDNLREAYELFSSRLALSTVGQSHQALAQQVVETRDLFTQFFEKCFKVEEGSTSDACYYMVMNNHQLMESVRQFATWVKLDVNAVRAKFERIPDDLLPKIALAVALDNKEHWHSTQYQVYAKSLALALALEHKEYWYSTQERAYAGARRDSI
jgi:hypothetical protein